MAELVPCSVTVDQIVADLNGSVVADLVPGKMADHMMIVLVAADLMVGYRKGHLSALV